MLITFIWSPGPAWTWTRLLNGLEWRTLMFRNGSSWLPRIRSPNPSSSSSHVRQNDRMEATSTNVCLPPFKLSNRLFSPPEFRLIDTPDLSRNCSRSVRTKRSRRFQSTCPPSFSARPMARPDPARPRSSPRPVSQLWLEFTVASVTLFLGWTHQTMSSSRPALARRNCASDCPPFSWDGRRGSRSRRSSPCRSLKRFVLFIWSFESPTFLAILMKTMNQSGTVKV